MCLWENPATWFNHYDGGKFRSGSIAYLRIASKVGPNSKLVLSAFEDFQTSAKKVTDLKEETSQSVAFKLETGDLVVDVKKLNRDLLWSNLDLVWQVFEYKFGLSANSESTKLAVLKKVGFLDANQKAEVWRPLKVSGSEDGAGELNALPESEKMELTKAVADSQESLGYDLTRLANTVEGYT